MNEPFPGSATISRKHTQVAAVSVSFAACLLFPALARAEGDGGEISWFTIVIGRIDKLRRIYYHTKRIAKSVADVE